MHLGLSIKIFRRKFSVTSEVIDTLIVVAFYLFAQTERIVVAGTYTSRKESCFQTNAAAPTAQSRHFIVREPMFRMQIHLRQFDFF